MHKALVRASGARGAGEVYPSTSTPSAGANPAPHLDHCGADGGEHDWVVSYWIGGERDECGEHVICRKCHEEYVP